MYTFCQGEDANQVWEKAYGELLQNSNVVDSRGGEVKEKLHCLLQIENPVQRWVYQRTPVISIAFALAEVIWILSGSDDATIINTWNPLLAKYAGNEKNYHGAYGYRLRKQFNMDQIDRAYHALKNMPDSRQVVLSIWCAERDFPDTDGKPVSADIPCNICSLLKVRDGRLEWTQIMRSNDINRGLPYNIVQYTTIQEILSGWLGLEVGTYTHYADSLHMYSTDRFISMTNDRYNMQNSDSLKVEKEESELYIKNIFSRMQKMAYEDLTECELEELCKEEIRNPAYNNIWCIIAMYYTYRKGFTTLQNKMKEKCTNGVYLHMWDMWVETRGKAKNKNN